MQLQRLTSRNPERGIADLVTQIEFGEQLLGVEFSSGNHGAEHHGVGLAATISAGCLPFIAVILLVTTVMLEELDTAFAKKSVFINQFFGNFSAKELASFLKLFDRAHFWRVARFRRFTHETFPRYFV